MVDTGADISTVQESIVRQHFSHAQLGTVATSVRNFDGKATSGTKGTLCATASHNDCKHNAQLRGAWQHARSGRARLIYALKLQPYKYDSHESVPMATLLSSFPSLLDDRVLAHFPTMNTSSSLPKTSHHAPPSLGLYPWLNAMQ